MKRIIVLLALAGSICVSAANAGSITKNAGSITNFPKKIKVVKLTKKGTIKKKYLRHDGTLKRNYRVER
ncbi:MAG TPA: hypothetical protein VNW99_03175 [Cytophagaceae bacterium]|nr:hypothetical protein [Cytophagaceae bacterium]